MSLIGLLGFGSVVLLAMAVLHGWLWFRLVRSTTRRGPTRRRLTVLTVVLMVLPVAAVVGRRDLPYAIATPLDWVGFSWLGIAFYAFLALLVLEPVRWVLRAVQRRRTPAAVPTPVEEPAPEPAPEPAYEPAPGPKCEPAPPPLDPAYEPTLDPTYKPAAPAATIYRAGYKVKIHC